MNYSELLHGVDVAIGAQEVLVNVLAGSMVAPGAARDQRLDVDVEIDETIRRGCVVGPHTPHDDTTFVCNHY